MKVSLATFFLFISSITFSQSFTLRDSIVKKGDVLRTHVYFDFNKTFIRDDMKPFLDSLGTFLTKQPKVRMEIGMHTDLRASENYSVDHSSRRADSIAFYLATNHHIEPSRLIKKCYGKSNPLFTQFQISKMNKDNQEKAHYENRRTEFTIIEILE